MSRLLSILAVGLLLLAPPVSSEERAAPPPDAAEQTDAEAAADKPGEKAAAQTREKTPAQRAREFRTQLLAGVELSADQTRRIDEIEREHVQRETRRLAQMDALRGEMRQARRDGDAERVIEYADKLREARKERGGHVGWIHEVRLILDYEQQKQFDANREQIRRESWRRNP
ncbi:MAG: hypothetical protein ACYS0K_23320 [Planctomycetota bacterium]